MYKIKSFKDTKKMFKKYCRCVNIYSKDKNLYNIWKDILYKCTNKESPSYKYYGEKGVSIYEKWKTYKNFFIWSKKNGYKYNTFLIRKDNDKDYSPENCVWVKKNKTDNDNGFKINIYGDNFTIKKWSNFLNINENVVRERIESNKYTFEESVLLPTKNDVIRLKTIDFENFSHYKEPCTVLCVPFCDFKCTKTFSENFCQNCHNYNLEIKEYKISNIINSYLNNPISKCIVFAGFEPMWSIYEIFLFLEEFRKFSDDNVIIYTGYYKNEISKYVELLKKYKNIIIKYGRYIPNQETRFDSLLGVELASSNQYAIKIS